jgi:quercetin dioxygenase-like cupin family protein
MKFHTTVLTTLLTTMIAAHAGEDGTAAHGKPREATSPRAEVTPLLMDDIEGAPGKAAALVLVRFPPGSIDPIHRHNALVYVYMLEGSVAMQVRGGPEVILKPGQTFVEKPSDIHVVGRNTSKTKPARFLAYFVKDRDAPPVLPAE